jgi:hypothetical protein
MHYVTQHLLVHQPLEPHYDSIMNEQHHPQLSYQGFTLVTYPISPPTSPLPYPSNYLCKWVSIKTD